MSLTITDEKTFNHPKAVLFDAALGAISGLEGNIEQQNMEEGTISVKFHKTILGKVLGDRTHFEANFSEVEQGKTAVSVSCYPLDAVGRKLMFGARKGVSKTVITWFWAHLEHRLPKETT